ncbi:MAG: Smr/MutS family protein [Bacteroidia bacterium]
MFYPKSIYQKLGFDHILKLTTEKCNSQRAKALVSKIQLSADEELVLPRLGRLTEMKRLIVEEGFNISLPIDIQLESKDRKAAGFFYSEEQLVELMDLLRAIAKITTVFSNKHEQFPLLFELIKDMDPEAELLRLLDKSLDEEGNLKPNASPKLQKLNSEIKEQERAVLKQSKSVFKNYKDLGYLAETEWSIKNGRMVLPVLAKYKRKVEGLFLDQSSTGKICYIEPLTTVQANNRLSELFIQRNQEIVKVLRAISKTIAPSIPGLISSLHKLAVVELIKAKASLSVAYNWNLPEIQSEMHQLIEAKHPILQLSLEDKEIVPLDIEFEKDQRLIVISGPNAGGKSVALKTVGLLQCMLQSGYLVPASAESKMMIFQDIFIDIGDDQSIESDLSTYSSHLKTAKHIVNNCNEHSLVLMDEIGIGTDPTFGAPIAQAVLEAIHDRNAYGVITTHYSNIKSAAKNLERACNAAMMFDTDRLEPLYKLIIGQAGSSFSFEVARTIGLNKKLINRAKSLTDHRQYDLDLLLAEVQQQKEELELKINELERSRTESEKFEKEYRQLKTELEQQRKAILDKAKTEASMLIDKANTSIEHTIRTIKESKADKKATSESRQELRKQKTSLKVEKETKVFDFKVGDRVQFIGTETIGEIVAIGKKDVELVVNAVRTRTKKDKIQKVGAANEKKVQKYISRKSYADRQASFSTELDVRGKRTEEAIKEVDEWLDSAIILSMNNLRLIHGKGYGILKQQIRAHLQGHPSIVSIEYESIQQGGEGVSIIKLK